MTVTRGWWVRHQATTEGWEMSERAGGEAQEARHPIRVVARRTGISLHVLRAWERRYGVVTPGRGPGGQRLYTDADMERLRLLRLAVGAGRAISVVAELGDTELAALVAQDREAEAPVRPGPVPPGPESSAADVGGYLRACLAAAEQLDHEAVQRVLMRAVVSLRPVDFMEGVVGPLLEEVGERWHRGELPPAHEHAVSAAVRNVLAFLLAAFEPVRSAPVLVATTIEEDAHEFGALLAALQAAEWGWRVLYLGPSLPAAEIARAARLSRAAAVVVSAVNERPEAELVDELGSLRAQLAAGVRLLVGGRGISGHEAAVDRVGGVEHGGLELLRRTLPRVPTLEVQ